MMIIALSMIVGALALVAGDYPYSSTMCLFLEGEHPGQGYCARGLSKQTNKYCKGDMFFFSEAEIGEFIDNMKIDTSDYDKEIAEGKKMIDQEIDALLKLCGSDKMCKDLVYVQKDVGLASMYSSYDASLGGYGMANNFNLGAVCIGANSENRFEGQRPIITDSIIKRLEDLCGDAVDMMESYVDDYAKSLGRIDNKVKDALLKEYDAAFDKVRDGKTCYDLARSATFHPNEYLSAEYTGWMIEFLRPITEDLQKYMVCIGSHLEDPSACQNVVSVGTIGERTRASTKRLLAAATTIEGNFAVDNKAGFDLYGASKASQPYKEMTKLPSKMSGGGLPGWAIAVIVIAVLLVLAGIGVAVYCLVIKPKKAQKI